MVVVEVVVMVEVVVVVVVVVGCVWLWSTVKIMGFCRVTKALNNYLE